MAQAQLKLRGFLPRKMGEWISGGYWYLSYLDRALGKKYYSHFTDEETEAHG